jgi:DNA polymerase III delta prime subunit
MLITHHALLIFADAIQSITLRDIPKAEIYDTYYDKFGIDEARGLIQQAGLRPLVKEKQCFIVRTLFITHEAQNALLKILEEPPDSSVIVFVVPKDLSMLPTLSSRFAIGNDIVADDIEQQTDTSVTVFTTFLRQDYKERLEKIEQAMKKGDQTWQREIKSGLVQHLRQADAHSKEEKQYPALLFVASKLLTRGASNKMLLEHLALTIQARSKVH